MSQTASERTDQNASRGARRPRQIAYEGAGPARLAKTPAVTKRQPANVLSGWKPLRSHSEARVNQLRSWRYSWFQHWQLLEMYILPRRGIFINSAMPQQNAMIRGMPINTNIVDPTATFAMRKCAAGLMSNEMSPSRQWFKLRPALFSREEAQPDAIEWFEEVEDRMAIVMNRSNFYQESAQVFEDLVTFGTACLLIYEDEQDLVRCYTPCCGEYFLASSSANRVETFARLFVMTVSAIVEMFGLENCPKDVQAMWREKGAGLEQEKIVAHIIEPNSPLYSETGDPNLGVVPGNFTWRELYWIYGSSDDYPLSSTGFIDQPHVVPRWAVTSNDAYGRSPGMDCLPDVLQLQTESARKAEAIEKQVRPPMLASIEMKNEPASILPGKVTYVNSLGADKGFRPAFEVVPNIADMKEDLLAIQARIKEGFFNDIFAMLEQVTRQMTAYEVAQRNQERLTSLGPVIERLQNEYLAPAIKRIFRIMERKGLLPPLPKSLLNVTIGIDYVGIIALSAKAAKTSTLERFVNQMNQMKAVEAPGTIDSVDDLWSKEEVVREYGSDLFISQKVFNTPMQIATLRKAKATAAAQQHQMAMIQQGANAAKSLGQTDMGPDTGMGAMAAMTGLGAFSRGGQVGNA